MRPLSPPSSRRRSSPRSARRVAPPSSRAWPTALEADREALVELADRETALGRPRLPGELTRTIYQLRFFADVIRDGAYLDAMIDPAHESPMGPLADVRRYLVPLGPVAVFGASNFPFAFSVAGGDTAAAIAAGCPVVAKAHSSHPALSAAVHRAIVRGAEAAGAPEGTIGLVFGREGGTALVTHPGIRAVAFTGSTAGGRALFDLASARPDPIPFFGELGSLNPLAVTPAAAAERAPAIAQGWVASFTLGSGQFCTKPGLALVPAGADGDAFRDAASAAVAAVGPSTMLNGAMRDAYLEGTARMAAVDGIALETRGVGRGRGSLVAPTLVETTTDALRADGSPLLAECFGPVGVLARYRDEADLLDILGRMEGSLTASVHIGEGETDLPARVLDAARAFAGPGARQRLPDGRRGQLVDDARRPVARVDERGPHVGRRDVDPPLPPSAWRSRTSPTSCSRPSCATRTRSASRGAPSRTTDAFRAARPRSVSGDRPREREQERRQDALREGIGIGVGALDQRPAHAPLPDRLHRVDHVQRVDGRFATDALERRDEERGESLAELVVDREERRGELGAPDGDDLQLRRDEGHLTLGGDRPHDPVDERCDRILQARRGGERLVDDVDRAGDVRPAAPGARAR